MKKTNMSVSLTIDRSLFCLCSLSPSLSFSSTLSLSLFPSLVQRTDDPISKKINYFFSLLWLKETILLYSVTFNIFKCCKKLKGLFQCVPLYSYIAIIASYILNANLLLLYLQQRDKLFRLGRVRYKLSRKKWTGGGKKQKERKTRERKIAKKKKEKRRFSIDTRYTYTLYLDTIPSRAHRKKTEETRVYYTHTRVYTYTQKGEEKKEKKKRTNLLKKRGATRINM